MSMYFDPYWWKPFLLGVLAGSILAFTSLTVAKTLQLNDGQSGQSMEEQDLGLKDHLATGVWISNSNARNETISFQNDGTAQWFGRLALWKATDAQSVMIFIRETGEGADFVIRKDEATNELEGVSTFKGQKFNFQKASEAGVSQ